MFRHISFKAMFHICRHLNIEDPTQRVYPALLQTVLSEYQRLLIYVPGVGHKERSGGHEEFSDGHE